MKRTALNRVAVIVFCGLAGAAAPAAARGPDGGMGPCGHPCAGPAGGPGGGPGGGWGPCGGPGGGMGPGTMMLEWLDEDDDGTVTLEEFQAGHAERFTEMDANGDGEITPDEFKTPPKPKETRMQRMFRRLDANKDGVVTLDEFEKRSEVKFERFDLNGDKVITIEEMQQVMMRGPRPQKVPGTGKNTDLRTNPAPGETNSSQ